MKHNILAMVVASALVPLTACAGSDHGHKQVSDQVIENQRAMLEKNTDGKGLALSRHVTLTH